MRLQGKKVLLVDDDPVLKKLLARVLETAGCIPIPCDGVKAALKCLEEVHPDLVILDLNMPEVDGFAFLKFRKMNKLLSAIPVIVLSGSTDRTDVQRALELGAEQFLIKPFEARIILQKLRYVFFKRENFKIQFKESELPQVEVEIAGELLEQGPGRLKLESQVRFLSGRSVRVNSVDYAAQGGDPLVCAIEKHVVDLKDGLFRTPVAITGTTLEDKPKLEKWLRSLGE